MYLIGGQGLKGHTSPFKCTHSEISTIIPPNECDLPVDETSYLFRKVVYLETGSAFLSHFGEGNARQCQHKQADIRALLRFRCGSRVGDDSYLPLRVLVLHASRRDHIQTLTRCLKPMGLRNIFIYKKS